MSAEEDAGYAYQLAGNEDIQQALGHLDNVLKEMEDSIAHLAGTSRNSYLADAQTLLHEMRELIQTDFVGRDAQWREKLTEFANWLMSGGY